MKFLTLRQPWASLVAVGAKTVETRPFGTAYRGPLAIHAGLAFPGSEMDERLHELSGCRCGHPAATCVDADLLSLPRGEVVAVCDLVDVVPIMTVAESEFSDKWLTVSDHGLGLWLGGMHVAHRVTDQLPFGDFTPGRHAWLLDNVRRIDPIPMKGAQGLRDVPDEIAAQIEAAS